MGKHFTRRNVLRQFGALGASAVGASTGVFSTPLQAIEPIVRDGKPRFSFSLAAYSYRDLLTGKSPQLTLDDFIKDCAAMGLEGTELTSYYFPKEVTDDYLRHLKHLTFTLGLDISGTAVRNDFCLPKGEARDKSIAHVKQWIRYAETMGAPVIRIFSGSQGKDQSLEDAHRLAVEGIEACCQVAGQHGVFLALENHGGLTTTVDGLLALVRDVKSPWFGVNLDSGNFHSDDIYGDLAKLAPYAINVQIKVVVRPSGKRPEPCDLSRMASIMRDSAYRGYIVLEYEEDEDPRKACPEYIAKLREAFV